MFERDIIITGYKNNIVCYYKVRMCNTCESNSAFILEELLIHNGLEEIEMAIYKERG
jgi:hypothetical protein